MILESLHSNVDKLIIELNQNIRDGLVCTQLPKSTLNVTRTPQWDKASPQVQLNNIKMHINTEKVISNISSMLQLIKEIRAQALIHD